METYGKNWNVFHPGRNFGRYWRLNVHETWSPELFDVIKHFNIEHLFLIDWQQDNLDFLKRISNQVIALTLNTSSLKDVSSIHCLENLKSLSISGKVNKIDFTKLENLEELRINENSPGNYLECSWLKSLHLSFGISNLHPLSKLRNLVELGIGTGKLASLDGLNCFPNLRALWLYDLKLENLSGISAAPQLTWLWVNGLPKLVDITEIAKLKGVLSLTIKGCSRLRDLGPLAALSELEKLDMDDGKEFTSLKPLQNLSNMRILSFWETRITDGDMRPLINFRKPQFIGFHNRRNYNMTLEEVKADYSRRGILLENDYMDYVEPKDR